jgi:purine nucleoside phosphorylase
VARAEIGVFGGSGFYSFLEDVKEVEVETPFGKPSAPLTIGEVGGKRVAFLPRHGRDHELPPHAIPYRANVWAMKELGVRRLIGPNASGALKAELELGEFVVCDQFVDRTGGRVGVEGTEPVSHEQVMMVFNENNEKLRELLFAVIPKIAPQPEEHLCATALRGARF